MARVLGYQNAILRGKLGGVVHSANRYGEYVRQYVKPVNPNTAAQAVARGNFTQALSLWHDLDDDQKNGWNSYAASVGGLSGINEFVSLRQRAITNARIVEEIGSSLLTMITGDETLEATAYTPPLNAPDPSIAAPFSLIFDDLSISREITGELSITTQFLLDGTEYEGSSNVPAGTFEPGFGITAYMSNQIAQEAHYVNSPHMMKIGASIPFDEITEGTEASTGVSGNFQVGADYKSLPDEGIVRITTYWESIDGRKWLIGAKYGEIPEPISE